MSKAMNSTCIWQIVCGVFLWLCAAGSASAQQGTSLATWPRPMNMTITLGDGDSIARARTMALERIRQEASAAVGALVATTAQLQDDRYSEQIKMLTVAFIKVNQVVESISVNDQGRPVLKMTALVDLDQGAVAQVLNNWSRDEAKSREIVRLKEENARLQLAMRQTLNQPRQFAPDRLRQTEAMPDQIYHARTRTEELPPGVESNPDPSAVSVQTRAKINGLTSRLESLNKEKDALPSVTASNGATMTQHWNLKWRILELGVELDKAKALALAESLHLSGLPMR